MIWDVIGGVPVDYENGNIYVANRHPSYMHAEESGLNMYFQRYLLQKAISVFKFENLPEDWDETYFLYGLFLGGYVAVLNTDKYGIICQAPPNARAYGRNLYYQPNRVLIANPLLNTTEDLIIGEDTEVIKLMPDWGGLFDIISYYAQTMSVASYTSAVNILNSQLSYVIGVDDKRAAQEFKKIHQAMASGEPAIVHGKKLYTPEGRPRWTTFSQDLRANFIAPEILEYMAKLDARYCTEVGIPNINIAKESGVSDGEIVANNVDTRSKSDLWLETLNLTCGKVNKMFKLDINAKYRWEEVSKNVNTFDAERAGVVSI